MTLRQLILSVDPEQYCDSQLYQRLRMTKPEYGSNRRIQVKSLNGEIAITNVHDGSLGDIVTYPIDIEPDFTAFEIINPLTNNLSKIFSLIIS